ncbi:hypothetical protein BGX24_005958 [Mortierella sp. AD032]|nr:hypothetical protein BGX24_005958 [Mortierella sp. AD032]
MKRTSYKLVLDPNPPTFQRLQAIDLSTSAQVLNLPRLNGDNVFRVDSVTDEFGTFDQVKRFTKPNNWENLHRFPTELRIEETLYVSRAGDIVLQPERYVVSITGQDDYSYSMGDGLEDFSNTQNPEPCRRPSNADLLANNWTYNVTQREARMQPLFLALPKGPLLNGDIDSSVTEFKMFLLCRNRRTGQDTVLHFADVPGIDVKRPAEFLDKYSSTLMWSLRIFKNSLRDLKDGLQSNQEEHIRIAALLQKDLGLFYPDDVESTMDKMIDYLQEQLPENSMDWAAEGATPDRPTLSKHDVAALPSYLEPLPGQSLGDVGHQGLVFACDARGLEQWMCSSCYRLLYPFYDGAYIMNQIPGDLGEYDFLSGRLAFRPRDSTKLQELCRLDTTKVGRVNELTIDTDWDATTEDLQSIHDLAGKLGLPILTITITDTPSSDSTLGLSHHPSQTDAPSVSQIDDITRTTRPLIERLRQLPNVSKRLLDSLHIIFMLPAVSPTGNADMSTKGFTSTYVAEFEFHIDGIRLLDMETSLAEASKLQSNSLKSIAIRDLEPALTKEESLTSTTVPAIKKILRNNPSLSRLTLNWPVSDFLIAETMMETIFAEIASEQTSTFRLSKYTLVDNTDNHISVTFTLPNSRDTKSIIANITTRENGPDLERFLDYYGSFIQVLNINKGVEYTNAEALQDSTTRPRSSQLTNVMMPPLSDLYLETARILRNVLLSSKATLRQLILVGAPSDDEVVNLVLETLESIEPSQVVLFDDYSVMELWIGQVKDSLPDKSSVIVLDRIEELCRIAPGHDDASLEWLKTRQIELRQSFPRPSKESTHSLKVSPDPRRFRPSREEKPFRVLDANKNTTAVNAVPITNTTFGQVIFESDIVEKYGTFDHIESNGHLVPYLMDPMYHQRLLEPKQILAHYEGDMASPDGYYDVVYTPYAGGEGNQ